MTILIGGAPTGLLDSSQALLGRNDQTSTATTDNGDALFVNVASGNLLYAHQDAYLPSRGDDYSLLRTYNSRGAVTTGGAFNDARWGVSSTVSLSVIGTGTSTRYQVRYGEGSVFEYALDAATGKYISTDGAGAYETLEVLRDGAGALLGYTVVRADQTRLSFDAQGRLTRWEDTNGVFQSYTYGTAGITQVTDDAGHVITYAYNTGGRLTSVTDEGGVVLVRYTYSGGRLATVTDRMGHVTKYFYYTDGYLQRIELPAAQTVGGVAQSFEARVISFEYQTLTGLGVPPAGARVLSRMVDAEGKATSFSYTFTLNTSGARTGAGTTTVTDALGKTMRYSYRADGAITQVVDQLSRPTSYAYDAAGNLLSVSDRNGFGVVGSDSYYYRALRAELGYTDTTGAGKLIADLTAEDKTALKALFTARFSYDARGNVLTSTDNAGNTTTYTYTTFNKVATITTAEGGVTQFFYDTNVKQNLVQQVDPGGDVTRFTYDIYGNLLTRQVYLDRADAAKAPADVAADKKQVTTFFYDLYGNNIRTLDAEGVNAYGSYDHFGNLLSSTDGRGNLSRYTYDADNRLVQLQDPTGRKTLFAYDAVGNRIGITTDWNGHTVTQIFDRNNRLISTIHPAEDANAARTRTTTVGYDNVGNRTSVTDAEGRTTTYTYSARRELIEIKSAAVDDDGNATTPAVQYTRTLFYDFEGNTIWATDARGNATGYQYTRDGLLRLQTMADGQITQYSYDRNQNLLSVVAGLQLELSKRQTTTYAYDAENQLIRVTDAKGGVTAYAYDAPGNMAEMTDAAGRVSRMQYDRNNRLRFEVSAAVGVFDPVTGAAVIDAVTGLQQTVSYTVEHRFDADGNEIETIDQNGKSTRYAFDTVNRTTSMTDANGITTAYTYDGNDNVLGITITAAGATSPSQVSRYQYDEFDQLIAATDGVGNALVASDAALYQNLRKELGYTVTVSGVTRGKLVVELTQTEKTALLAAFTTRYTYDKVGNLKTETDKLGRSTSFDYDALNRLVKSTDALGGTREYRYDGNDNLLSGTDALGRTTTQTYDTMDRVATRSDPLGTGSESTVTKSVYDSFGNVKSVTEAFGTAQARSSSYEYDLNNLLTAAVDARGNRTSYVYDAVGNRIRATDARLNSTDFTYDALDRVVKVRDPLTFETRFEYDGVGNRIAMVDARGARTRMEFDPGNRMTTMTDGEGRKTVFGYDALGNTITVTTAAGTTGAGSKGPETTTYTYDAENNLRNVVDATGKSSTARFDRVYNEMSVTDARGNTTTTAFDALNRAVLVTDALGGTTGYTYDATGNVLSVRDANGQFTRYAYDRANQVITETDALGVQTTYAYDAFGATTTITRAANRPGETRVQSFAYDANGNVTQQTDALSGIKAYVYDTNNNLTRATDENGKATAYSYDANNRVATITDALGFVTRYTYDGNGNRTVVEDARGKKTTAYYNANNELSLTVDALGYATAYVYDANGNITRTTQYGKALAMPVNPATKPVPVAAAALDRTVFMTYDALNRVTAMTDALGFVTRYTYDANGNRTVVQDAKGNKSTAYFDANNRLTLEVDALGYATGYVYDALGNLTQQTQYETALTGYTPAAKPAPATNAKDRTTTFYYDTNNRLTLEVDALGFATAYAYDAVGNVTQQRQYETALTGYTPAAKPAPATNAKDRTTTFYYDTNNRLTLEVDALGFATAYVYDAVGNLIQQTQYETKLTGYTPGTKPTLTPNAKDRTTTFYYDADNRQTLAIDALGYATGYVYDAVGNVTQRTQYDTKLTPGYTPAAKPALATSAKDHISTAYYDANSRLSLSVDALGFATGYVYDAVGNVTQQTQYARKLTGYTPAAMPTPTTNPNDRITTFYYDGSNRLTLSVDALGYAMAYVYDAVGNVTQRMQYETKLTGYTPATKPTPATNAKDRTTTYYYDADNRQTLMVDALGYATAYVYDAVGNVTQQTQYGAPLGLPVNPAVKPTPAVTSAEDRKTTFYFDANNRLTLSVDELSYATGYLYDAVGNVTQQTQYATALSLPVDLAVKPVPVNSAADRSTSAYFDANNRLTLSVDELSYATGYVYDAVGNVTQQTQYATALSLPVNLAVKPTLVTNAKDRSSTLYYDANNRQSLTVDAEGYATTYVYDAVGNVTQRTQYETKLTGYTPGTKPTPATNAKDRTTVMSYDALDRVTTMTDALGFVTRYSYDAVGNRTVVEDAKGNKSTAYFDANNRLTLAVDALGYATGYVYDAVGNVTQETRYETALTGYTPGTKPVPATNAKDRTTNLSYDRLNRQIKVLDAAGQSTRYFYDAFSNLIVVEDPNGVMTFNIYDRGNRLEYSLVAKPRSTITAQFPDGQIWGRGNLEIYFIPNFVNGFSANNGIKTSYTYDATNPAWVASTTVKFGNGTGTATVMQYSHDLLGRITREQGTDGSYRAFRYDALGDLLELDDNGIVTLYTYDLLGRETIRTREQSAGTGTGIQETRSYDAVGNVISRTDERGNTTSYFYDGANRLSLSVDALGYATAYVYDAVGNLIQQTQYDTALTGYTPGTKPTPATNAKDRTTTFYYDADNRQTLAMDALGYATAYVYDAVGNVTQRTQYETKLTGYTPGTKPTPATNAKDRTTTFYYDADNRQTLAMDALGYATAYVYDAVGNVTQRTQYETKLTGYTPATKPTPAVNAKDRTTTLYYDVNSQLTLEVDALGYATAYVYDAVGNVTQRTQYETKLTGYTPGTKPTPATNAKDRTTTRYYDVNSQLTLEIDALGYATAYVYDAVGNVTQRTQYETKLTSYTPATKPTLATNAKDRTTTLYYDVNSQLTLEIDALGYATAYVYDAVGNVTQQTQFAAPLGLPVNPAVKPTPAVTSAEDRKTTFYFDANNRLTLSVDELSYATGYLYDAVGNVTQQTQYATALSLPVSLAVKPVPVNSAADRSISAYFDANNRLSLSVDALGYATGYVYDAVGNVTQQTQYATSLSLPVNLAVKPTLLTNAKDRSSTFYYDANNRQSLTVDAEGYATTYVYDAVGNVTQRMQYETKLTGYTAGTKPTPATNAKDRTTVMSYDALDRVTTMTDALGFVTRYSYDAVGNRTVVEDAKGNKSTAYFDANNRLTLAVDALGYATAYVYDAVGNVTQQTQYETALTGYTPGTKPVPATNAKDRTTNLSYDRLNRQIKVVDAAGQSTRYFYDAFSNLIVVEDPNRVMTFNIYDRGNRLEYSLVAKPRSTITAQFPDGQVWGRVNLEAYFIPNFVNGFSANNGIKTSYTYDAANPAWVASTTVKFGNGTGTATVMQYTHDKLGRITREQGTDGSYRAFRYDALDDLLELDDNGIVTLYTYDLLGRETTRIREQSAGTGTGIQETRYYDAVGNVISRTDEPGNTTTYAYDAINRLLSASYDAGLGVTTQTYDAVGNLLSVISPEGGAQYFAYDADNRVVRSLSEAGYLTVYQYDAAGNETARYEYNGVYALAADGSVPLPRGDDTARVTQSTWDSMNRLVTRTDSEGLITTYSYDAAGNPTGSTTRTAATTARSEGTLGYDSNDRIIRQVDAAGVVTTYTLNAVGNVLVKVEASGTATARTTTYTYDQGGTRLRSETTAAGRLTRYEYEGGSDRLTRKTVEDAADATHTILREETWSYYANGELQLYVNAVGMRTVHTWDGGLKKSITYAEGTASAYTVTYSYDAKNRLLQEDTGILFQGQMVSVRYAYDNNDNLTVKTEAAGIAGQERITRYAHDAENRLIRMTDAEGNSTRYGYDAAGDQVWVLDATGMVTITRKNARGLVSERLVGEASLDPNGIPMLINGLPAITSARGGIKTSYTYDVAKPALVASMTVAFADGTGDAHTTRYTYDALDRQNTVTDAEGFTSSYSYDDFGNLRSVTVGSYAITSGQPGFDQAKANRAHPQTTTFVYDAADNLIQSVDGNGNATNATYDVLGYKQTVTSGVKTSTSTSQLHSFTTEYDWYADGTLKEQRDADGGITRIVRNSLGLQTRVSVLQRYGYESVYSGNGGYTVVQVEVGSITDFTYLTGKRLHTETTSSGTSTVVKTIAYDAFGNITGNTLASAQASYVRATSMRYDRLDRLSSQLDPMGGTTAYTYDAAGNLKSVTDANGAVTRYYYDDYNRLRAEIDAEGYLTVYTRDAFGNCIAKTLWSSKPGGVTDTAYTPGISANDRLTRYTFDGNNTLRTQTEPSGLKKTWTYDGAGNLKTAVSSVTNAAKALYDVTESLADRTESWSYDNAGQLIGYVSVDAVVESFTHDSAGNQIQERITNPGQLKNGQSEPVHITDYTYDAMNRLTSWDSGTLRRAFSYDVAGNKIEEQDGLNQATTYNYDLLNQLVEVRDAEGVKRGFSYHAYGQIESEFVYDGDTKVVQRIYEYDRNNRLIKETGPTYDTYNVDAQGAGTATANDSGVTTYAYDAVGNLKTRTDERGFVTTSWYDKRGSVIATLSGELILQRFSYNAFNELATLSTDRKPGGTSGQGVSRSSATPPGLSDPIIITNTLDTMGHVTRTTYPIIAVTSVDPVTRAVTVTQAQPFESSAYDAWGNLVRSTDRNGNISYAFFDARGRVTAAVDGDGYLTQTAYDSHGNVVLQTRYATPVVVSTEARPTNPASGQTQIVTRVYNAENQLIREISPEVNTESGLVRANTTFLYDAAGNLVQKTFDVVSTSLQRSESYTYDNVNRLASVKSEEGVLNVLTRDYLGNVTSRYQYSNPEGLAVKNKFVDKETRYTYNRAGLLIRESEWVYGEDPASGTNGEQWFSTLYSYDIAGNKTRKEVGDIDQNGALKPVDVPGAEGASARVFESFWRYNEAGKEILSAEADERRSTGVFLAGARRFTEYNTSGRITKTWQADPAAPTVKYKLFELEYNAIGAVINSNAGDGIWRQFGVDAAGNRVLTRGTGTKNDTTGALVVYDFYDARGNKTRHVNEIGAITETVFDYLGRVTARKLPGSLANSLNTTTYTYDSAGNLVSEVNPAGVSQTHYYNLRGQKVLSVFGEGNKQRWLYVDTTGHMKETWFEDVSGSKLTSSLQKFTTDSFGRITRVYHGLSAVADYDFDQRDNTRSVREIRWTVGDVIIESYSTFYWYDSLGNQILMRDGAGNFFAKAYNALGLVVAEFDWGRVYDTLAYNGANYDTLPTNIVASAGPTNRAEALSQPFLRGSKGLIYDVFGNILVDVDEGVTNTYTDYGRKKTSATTGVAIKSLTFSYDRLGRLEKEEGTSSYVVLSFVSLGAAPFQVRQTAAIYTQYQYDDASRVIKIHDRALKTLTEYEYDFANNKTAEWFGDGADDNAIAIGQRVSSINKIRYTKTVYDTGNRVVSQREWLSGFEVRYSYDLNNRISRRDTYYVEPGQFGQTQGAINLLDRFSFSYDAANRVLYDGEYTYTYDSQGRRASALKNGERAATTYTYSNSGLLKSSTQNTYKYADEADFTVSADGLTVTWVDHGLVEGEDIFFSGETRDYLVYVLTKDTFQIRENPDQVNPSLVPGSIVIGSSIYRIPGVTIRAGTLTTGTWTYDGAGNIAITTFTVREPPEIPGYLGSPKEDQATIYTRDAAGRVWKTVSGWSTTQSVLDNLGNAVQTLVYFNSREEDQDYVSRTTLYYENGDQYLALGLIDNVRGSGAPETASVEFDAQGRRVTSPESGVSTTYEYDSTGSVLEVTASGVSTRYLYANGQRWGEYTVPATGAVTDFTAYSISRQPGDEFPRISTDRHTVQEGETLRSIAAQYFGSADLWYVIAEANGLSGTETLQRGHTLQIPATTANEYRTAGTFLPAKGLVGVATPVPTAAEPDECTKIATIVAVVLIAIAAVILTVVTAGAAAPAGALLIVGASASVATLFIVGAVIGAVIGAAIAFAASAISQALLVNAGLQSGFDWEQVAVDTLVGGLAGALSGGAATFANLAKLGKVAALSKPLKAAATIAETALDVAAEAAGQAILNNGQVPNPEYLGIAAAGGALGGVIEAAVDVAKAVKKSRALSRAVKASTAALDSQSPLRIADDPNLGRRFEAAVVQGGREEQLAFLKAARGLKNLDASSDKARLEADRIQRVFVNDEKSLNAAIARGEAPIGERNLEINLPGLGRTPLQENAPLSPEWFKGLTQAEETVAKSLKQDFLGNWTGNLRANKASNFYLPEALPTPVAPGRLGRFAASAKAEAANRWRGTGEFFSARFSGAASAWGSVRSGAASARGSVSRVPGRIGDFVSGKIASYKANAAMKKSEKLDDLRKWNDGVELNRFMKEEVVGDRTVVNADGEVQLAQDWRSDRLDRIMENPNAYAALKSFNKDSKVPLDELDFLDELSAYRNIPDLDLKVAKGKEINDRFIRGGAKNMVGEVPGARGVNTIRAMTDKDAEYVGSAGWVEELGYVEMAVKKELKTLLTQDGDFGLKPFLSKDFTEGLNDPFAPGRLGRFAASAKGAVAATRASARASEAAAAAATRSRGLQRANDVEMFTDSRITPQTILRLFNDADVGPGLRKAVTADARGATQVKFLADVSRLKSVAPNQQDAIARGIVDTYIRDLNALNLKSELLRAFAKKFDEAGQKYSIGMFDKPETDVARGMVQNGIPSSSNLREFRKSDKVKAFALRLGEEQFKSPLDRLAAASPMVRSKSAQNALSAGYFDNQAAARATEFARFNIENASSPGDQFYAAWDNPQLQKSVRDASSVGGKFQDETYVFALATRDYQRARLAGNAQGVTDALDKLSERITQRASTPYAGSGFDDLNAPEEVLAVNMNQKADELFNRAIHNREYDVLDRTLPVAVNKLLAADSIRQADRFTNFGKFLDNNRLIGANLPNNPEVAEVNKLLGIFGS